MFRPRVNARKTYPTKPGKSPVDTSEALGHRQVLSSPRRVGPSFRRISDLEISDTQQLSVCCWLSIAAVAAQSAQRDLPASLGETT
jgi:hypothetical protein